MKSRNFNALIILPVGWLIGAIFLFNAPKALVPLILIYGVLWLWSINQYVVKNKPIPFFEKSEVE